LIAGFLVVAFVVAMVTRFATYFSPDNPNDPTNAPLAPVAWLDTRVLPGDLASPTPAASQVDGVPAPSRFIQSLQATLVIDNTTWFRGSDNHFTVELTNTSQDYVSFSPCPVYRMYITGTDPTAAPMWQLNCNVMPQELVPGQSIDLQMVYRPTVADPLGPNQQFVWQWVSPDDVQAMASATVYITA